MVNRYVQLAHPKKLPAHDLAGGRLLVYLPDENLAHGLEETETEGFLDFDNVPAWDTWIGYVREVTTGADYVLSWIPREFTQLVQWGIDVCPDQSIAWIDSRPKLIELLARAGLHF